MKEDAREARKAIEEELRTAIDEASTLRKKLEAKEKLLASTELGDEAVTAELQRRIDVLEKKQAKQKKKMLQLADENDEL